MRARSWRSVRQQLLAAVLLLSALPALADDAPLPLGGPAMSAVSQQQLLRYLADNSVFTLLDARSPDEYAASHVQGALNVPFDALDAHDAGLPESLDAPIVVYCKTGVRAGKLRAQLTARGYRDVRVLAAEQIFWSDDLAVFNCAASPAMDSLLPDKAQASTQVDGGTR